MKNRTNPALIIVILPCLYLVVSSTFSLPGPFYDFDSKRLFQLLLFSILMFTAVAWSPLRQSSTLQMGRLSVWQWYALLLFFTLGVISSLRIEHPAYALVDVSMMLVMMVLIAITAGSRVQSGRIFDKWAVALLATLGLAVALQELMGFAAGWVLGTDFNYRHALIHFSHPRFYNQLQTWSIPVIAALPLLFPQKRWMKTACIVLLGLQWFLIIFVAARGTVVSLFVAMVFVAIWLPAQRKFWLRYQLAGLLTGIVIYSSVFLLNSTLIPQSGSGEFYAHSVGRPLVHTSGRSVLWRLSANDAINHPVLGAGPGRYACGINFQLPAHPHSFPFRLAGEWGLIAFSLVLILAVSIGRGFLRSLRSSQLVNNTDPPLRAILAVSLIAGSIHACVRGLLIMPASQVMMILIAGWTLGLSKYGRHPTPEHVAARTASIAGLLICIAILVFASSEIRHLPERTAYAKQSGPMVPRFWQNGKICEYSYTVGDTHL